MEAYIRRSLSRGRRVEDYVDAHPITDSGFTAVVTRLTAAVARGEALATQQHDGINNQQAAVARRRQLKRAIWIQLRRLNVVGALAARSDPSLLGQFALPSGEAPNKEFVLAARSMLAAAVPLKDQLNALGLGDTFVDDLTKATDEFDASTTNAHSGRDNHVEARGDLRDIVREVGRDVTLLDTYYRALYAENDDLMAGWLGAKNLVGPFRHSGPDAPPETPPAAAAA